MAGIETSGSASAAGAYPQQCVYDLLSPRLSTGGTWTNYDYTASQRNGYSVYQAGPAVNDYIDFDMLCDAGTYEIWIMHTKNTDAGQIQFLVDGVNAGAIVEGYNASLTYNNVATRSTASLSAGRHTLRMQIPSKHASSTNYYGQTQMVAWRRTGA